MSGSNLLSICCLGYNHANFIKDNIEAIWNSTYRSIEIIAIDDGSNDSSVEILKELQKKSPFPMTVVAQKNTGNVGHNFNVALKKASGDFVTFMSLDDVLCSEKIKECIDKLISNKNLAFVASSKVSAINSYGKNCDTVSPLKLDSMKNVTIDDLLELEYGEFGSFYIQGTFFRKSIIDAVSGFDEDMTGDDIVLRTKVFRHIKGHPEYSFEIVQEATCLYRRHGNNVSRNIKRQIQIVTEYLQRYWSNRSNPDILISWGVYAIQSLSFGESLSVFSMNAKAALLLNNKEIQQQLIKKITTSNSIFRYFFSKERQGDKRIIRILHFIKITYERSPR